MNNAFKNERITYKVFPAEKADIESSTVDLITVAQALHWFNFEEFYNEVRRVLKKDGVIAVWLYDIPKISLEVDLITKKFDEEILKNYWPPERQLLYDKYKSIPFPFKKIEAPEFEMITEWTYNDLLGFLDTWSGTQKFKDRENKDPLTLIREELIETWGDEKFKKTTWKFILIIGKV